MYPLPSERVGYSDHGRLGFGYVTDSAYVLDFCRVQIRRCALAAWPGSIDRRAARGADA
jgi:hypothetical protein